MRTSFTRLSLSALAVLAMLPAAAVHAQAPAAVETYKIDPVHSNVGFRVRHLMSKVNGKFGQVDGTIKVDKADVSRSTVEVTLQVASVTTSDAQRDTHLKGPDFFDAAKFPVITFKSTSVKQVAKDKLEVTGTFTMKGVTKTLVLPIVQLGTSVDPWKNVISGFEGAISLDRQDYGVSYGKGLVGDQVDIELNIEAKKS
jgi:polyisoprenoid-binding protein YceI